MVDIELDWVTLGVSESDKVLERDSEWDCERLIDCDNEIESVMDNELDWVKLTDCDRER